MYRNFAREKQHGSISLPETTDADEDMKIHSSEKCGKTVFSTDRCHTKSLQFPNISIIALYMLPAALYNAGPQFVRHFLCGKGSQKTRHCHSFAVNFFYHGDEDHVPTPVCCSAGSNTNIPGARIADAAR